jgi:tetratricopeptide (TPR) repeat protein
MAARFSNGSGFATSITVVWLIAGASGCGGIPEQTQARVDEALAAGSVGDWSRAESILGAVLAEVPEYDRARLHRGEALLRLGRPVEALAELDALIQSGRTSETELGSAHHLRGSAFVLLGRTALADSDFRARRGKPDAVRAARDAFLAANVAFANSIERDETNYKAWIGRAYALYRQENYNKAVDVLDTCQRKQPGDWEHRFLRALVMEGLHGQNAQSYQTAIAIAEEPATADRLPLCLFLIERLPALPPDLAADVPGLVTAFRDSTGVRDETIERFLDGQAIENEQLRLAAARATAIERARGLAAEEKLTDAVAVIDEHDASLGLSDEVTALRNEIAERWLRLLDLRSQGYLRAADHKSLARVLDEYKTVANAATKLEIKISVQQKVNDLQLALAQMTSSTKIREASQLARSGEYRAVLELLEPVDPDGLVDSDRDLYHYYLGLARFHGKRWVDAVASFQSVRSRTLEDVDLYEGLALLESGRTAAGLERLANTPPVPGKDDVNRLVARYHAERGEHAKTLARLANIGSPQREDFEMEARSRTSSGSQKARDGDIEGSVEELRHARQIWTEKLQRTDPDVWLQLGHGQLLLDQHSMAKRTLEELVNAPLTPEERVRCRSAHIHLSQVHLREKREDLAYQDLEEYLRWSNDLPAELEETYGNLAAAYADYMPLDRVAHWNHASTIHDYNFTLSVEKNSEGKYRVERREGARIIEETWERSGMFVVQKTGRGGMIELRIPINLERREKTLPFVEYSTGEDGRLRFTSEIVATNRSVSLRDGKSYRGCLQVRLTRTIDLESGKEQRTRFVLWLAPEVGEIRRETYRDDEKVAETELTGIVLRDSEH